MHRQRRWPRVLRFAVVAVVDLLCIVAWSVYAWNFWSAPGQRIFFWWALCLYLFVVGHRGLCNATKWASLKWSARWSQHGRDYARGAGSVGCALAVLHCPQGKHQMDCMRATQRPMQDALEPDAEEVVVEGEPVELRPRGELPSDGDQFNDVD